MRLYWIIGLLFILFGGRLGAQINFDEMILDSISYFMVELEDGSSVIGKKIEITERELIIQSSFAGKITLKIGDIVEVKRVFKSPYNKKAFWLPNPNSTRYLISPSCFNLKPKEGYYQNIWVFLNSFNVGITKNISIGGGVELLSVMASFISAGEISPIFIITPKISGQISQRVGLGGGVVVVNVSGLGGAGIAYGITTYGTEDHNITGGLGWGFINAEFNKRPIIMVSGMTRLGERMGFVSENWIIPAGANNYESFISYGLRFFGRKISVDFAFVNNDHVFKVIPIGIPFLDFVVKF